MADYAPAEFRPTICRPRGGYDVDIIKGKPKVMGLVRPHHKPRGVLTTFPRWATSSHAVSFTIFRVAQTNMILRRGRFLWCRRGQPAELFDLDQPVRNHHRRPDRNRAGRQG